MHEGQHGACFVRERLNDTMILTRYGRSSGFCIDPSENKPLYHFYPGSSVLWQGTVACSLACKFCQKREYLYLCRLESSLTSRGLRYVYTGDVRHLEDDTTCRPGCGAKRIERDRCEIRGYRLTLSGCCKQCGRQIAGRFAERSGNFGRKRIPIAIQTS